MPHKYLCELFPDELPFPFCEEDYPDFDERDTYSLDYHFIAWLYERLRFFQDKAAKIVNFDFYKFNIDGEELTQAQCIARMIEDCKVLLLNDDFFTPDDEVFEALEAAKNDLFNVFKEVYWAMWW